MYNMLMKTIKMEDMQVSYSDDSKTKDAVFKHLIDFYKKHKTFSGEELQQSDEPILEAPDVLSEIADNIIKFKVKYD